jgi:hypothetical protein
VATIRQRVQRLLVLRGLEPRPDATGPADPLAAEPPIMAAMVGASVQGRVALGSRPGAGVRRLGDAGATAASLSVRGPWRTASLHSALLLVFGGLPRNRMEPFVQSAGGQAKAAGSPGLLDPSSSGD